MKTSDELWKSIAKELGIDHLAVTRADIKFRPNSLVAIDIEIETGEIKDNMFVSELHKYKLVENK